jgi:hypothetical protein
MAWCRTRREGGEQVVHRVKQAIYDNAEENNIDFSISIATPH